MCLIGLQRGYHLLKRRYFTVRNWLWSPECTSYDFYGPWHLQDQKFLIVRELSKTVTGKERPFDVLAAVLPLAHPHRQRQERLNPALREVLTYDLFCS